MIFPKILPAAAFAGVMAALLLPGAAIAGAGKPPIIHPSADPPAVPEPATWALMFLGMGAVGAVVRSARRRGRAALSDGQARSQA
jgi:hypothetical protein